MIRIYLDSSALVKRFNKEKGSDIVKKIFEKCEKGEIIVIVSQWTINECMVAFDKLLRIIKTKNFKNKEQKELKPKDIDNMRIDTVSWVHNMNREGKAEMVGINDQLITNSMGFIRFNHLSADDSLHAYCAAMGIPISC